MCPIRSSIHHRKDQISQLFYYIIQNLLQEVGDSQRIKTSVEVVKTSRNEFPMQKETSGRPSEEMRHKTKASRIIFSRCRFYRRL